MIAYVTALLNLFVMKGSDDRRGQSLVEYALIIVLIAIAVIAAVTLLSGQLGNVFNRITSSLNTP